METYFRSPVNSPPKSQWHGALMLFIYLGPNRQLSKQSRRCWFETPSCSLCRHCNDDIGCQDMSSSCLGENIFLFYFATLWWWSYANNIFNGTMHAIIHSAVKSDWIFGSLINKVLQYQFQNMIIWDCLSHATNNISCFSFNLSGLHFSKKNFINIRVNTKNVVKGPHFPWFGVAFIIRGLTVHLLKPRLLITSPQPKRAQQSYTCFH